MRDSKPESRALSVAVPNNSRSAKSTETANDRLLHFMAQPPEVEKHGEFRVKLPHRKRLEESSIAGGLHPLDVA
jgi:hypothetical protein